MKKIAPQYTGGAVDESLTAEAERLIRSLPGDTADLEEKIRRLLGRYRNFRKFYDTEPQVSVTIAHLNELAKQARNLREGLNLIPANAEAVISTSMWKAWDVSYFEYERSLKRDLTRLEVILQHAAKEFEPAKGRLGDKANSLEHALLSDVAGLLENQAGGSLGKLKLAGLAAEILISAKVHGVPGTQKRARDAINAWLKRSTT